MIRRVGVVGAGTMGSGIAQCFAQAGYDVSLCDNAGAALAGARRAIERSLDKFAEKGTILAADRDATLGRIRTTTSLSDLSSSDLVVEAIVEDETAKQALFGALDRTLGPAAILASNTSSIPISTLASATSRGGLVLGMHFMNPVPLMPLVEIVRAPSTSGATVDVAMEVCRALGKTAIESADRPGFIANRVLMPMINEAVHALGEGVGTRDAIDTVMKLGMRHPIGPLALADLIGLDVCVAIMDVMRKGLGDSKYEPAPLLRDKVAAGELGRKTARGFYEYPN